MSRPPWIEAWFSGILADADFQVREIDLTDSRDWAISCGAIRHASGLFFSITGVNWTSPTGQRSSQPLIEQREIGTLGFVMREASGGGRELLVQAKLEPGNVGILQLAPTCQATASNTARIHGGEAPPFSDLFAGGRARLVHESLQSEQGTRFLGKRNRNVLAMPRAEIDPAPTHRWLPVDELLELLTKDFLVNTDTRSVLVTSPWEAMIGRAPFSRHRSGFGAELAASYSGSSANGQWLAELAAGVAGLRSLAHPPQIVDLTDLEGWKLNRSGVAPIDGGGYAVRHIEVTAHGREVPRWDQPIVSSAGEGAIDLICGRIDGVLHLLFQPQTEPGLTDLVELGPSFVAEPGAAPSGTADIPGDAGVILETRQSEEGGRFYHDINNYRLIDAGEAYPAPGGYWLNLAQTSALLRQGGWFTNEARSALSLLLAWL